MDEGNAAMFKEKAERRLEARRIGRESWQEFWLRVLNNSPTGPTLFCPPAGFRLHFLGFDTVPHYLFRTFDEASSGKNDENMIASIVRSGSHIRGKTDILTLGRGEATSLLCEHLTKRCFSGAEDDNFMSWTSFLLFAIQYAIWRLRNHRCQPSDIKICAANANKFPLGQYARDISLLEVYHATAEETGGETQSFFNFRLKNEDYYNGEYLSQGSLSHTGRSSVVSLERLIRAGLYELYPEFEDPKGSELWTERVLELRQIWSKEQETSDRDIKVALGVGRTSFTQLEPLEVASVLL